MASSGSKKFRDFAAAEASAAINKALSTRLSKSIGDLQAFRKSLDEASVPYTQADLLDNNDWLRSNIKAEIFVDAFGQDEGMKVRAESDPEVLKGLDLLPQAKALADTAKRTVAEHNGSGAFNR